MNFCAKEKGGGWEDQNCACAFDVGPHTARCADGDVHPGLLHGGRQAWVAQEGGFAVGSARQHRPKVVLRELPLHTAQEAIVVAEFARCKPNEIPDCSVWRIGQALTCDGLVAGGRRKGERLGWDRRTLPGPAGGQRGRRRAGPPCSQAACPHRGGPSTGPPPTTSPAAPACD